MKMYPIDQTIQHFMLLQVIQSLLSLFLNIKLILANGINSVTFEDRKLMTVKDNYATSFMVLINSRKSTWQNSS